MICKEEPDPSDSEKESPNKGKKKDPNKVDKKYLWPHGLTPPTKNIRKRRFRKTLKKKNVEAPEIEKEVKRLLRIDNDAVKVDFEIINEEVDKPNLDEEQQQSQGDEYNEFDFNEETLNETEVEKTLNDSSSQKDINVESDGDDDLPRSSTIKHGDVGEHDIFGEEVSSSDDDDTERRNESRMQELEDASRLSADDSRMSDYSLGGAISAAASAMNISKQHEPTEFSHSMFGSAGNDDTQDMLPNSSNEEPGTSNSYYGKQQQSYDYDYSNDGLQMSSEQINAKISELRRQVDDLKVQQSQKAQEINSIQNPTLRQRMQETLDNLLSQMVEKELEIKDLENML